MKTNTLLKAAAAVTATVAAQELMNGASSTPKTKPNILFILVDDMGWGDLSCQYAKDLNTPNIDRIFETGLRMDNFYANSNVSSPSRAALMTGCFPASVGVPGVIRTKREQNWGYFSPFAGTMPEVLKSAGYNTALIGKWHLGLESPNLPNERGFDWFKGFLGDMMDDYYTHQREGYNFMFCNKKEIFPEGHATELFTEWGIDYLRSQRKEKSPFFMYLAYNAPHSPLQPPAEWLENVQERNPDLPEKRARLVALIEHLDYNIGKVMDELKRTGQYENTLVVFASDNGGDRGSMANNGPVRGAKGDMFEGGLRVPCAINFPGVYDGGRRDSHFMMLMDFLPTFCDLLDIPVSKDIDGMSVLPALNGEEQDTENRYIFWVRTEGGSQFCGKSQCAVRYGDYKFLQNLPFETPYMFNIAEDPAETTPLELNGQVYKSLTKALTNHYNKCGSVPTQNPNN